MEGTGCNSPEIVKSAASPLEQGTMALVVCKDCGKEISTEALACPQCGRPSVQHAAGQQVGNMLKGCAGIVVGSIMLVVAFVMLKACVVG